MKISARGFTLIEILVAIAVMGILSTAGYINYRAFSYEQALDDGVNRIQSILRTAQTNATASIKCKTVGSTKWMTVFTNTNTLELRCERSDNGQIEVVKQETLTNNIQLDSISGTSCVSSFPTNGVTFSFDTLSGKVSFSDPDPFKDCIATLSEITVKIKHTQASPDLLKTIIVGKGGGINAQN